MTEYTYTVLRELEPKELSDLEADCRSNLVSLIERYFSEYNLGPDFPSTAGDLDLVRGSWLLDKRNDRPEHNAVVLGVGFEFGKLLEREYGFSWSLIEDSYGESVSMVRSGQKQSPISVPPFSYLEKREQTQNVEVIHDFFKQVSHDILGDGSRG